MSSANPGLLRLARRDSHRRSETLLVDPHLDEVDLRDRPLIQPCLLKPNELDEGFAASLEQREAFGGAGGPPPSLGDRSSHAPLERSPLQGGGLRLRPRNGGAQSTLAAGLDGIRYIGEQI